MGEWIRVEDRLPDENTDVLAVFPSGNMVVCRYYDQDEDITFWQASVDDGWSSDMDFTPSHWMPLPEPPKEG